MAVRIVQSAAIILSWVVIHSLGEMYIAVACCKMLAWGDRILPQKWTQKNLQQICSMSHQSMWYIVDSEKRVLGPKLYSGYNVVAVVL